MNIKVGSEGVGECNIRVDASIEKVQEYRLKSLCCLQLMCINFANDPEKFNQFDEIVTNTMKQLNELFKDSEEMDGTEQF